MVLCKFYLQGTCKFGDNCKFEHQGNDLSNGTSTSILRQQTFGAPTTSAKNVDTATLVRSVQTDMLNTEKSGQWMLSSYAPFKDKQAFPGFEDKSFEEVRLGFYEAKRTGTIEQYKQQLQMVLQDVVAKIKVLQNPTPELVNIIKEIYNNPAKLQFGQQQNFAMPTNNQVFPSAAAPAFVGQQNNSANIFAQTTAPTTNQNIFAAANQKLFPPQNSIFASNQPSQNNFGQNVLNQPNGIFASQQQQPQTMQGSIFNNQMQANINPVQSNSIFNKPNPTSFPPKQPQNNMFASMQSNSNFNTVQEQKPMYSQQGFSQNTFQTNQQQQQPFTTNIQPMQNTSPLLNNTPAFANGNQQGNFINPQSNNFGQIPGNSNPFGLQVNPSQFNMQQQNVSANQTFQQEKTNNEISSSIFSKQAGISSNNGQNQQGQMQNIFGGVTPQSVPNLSAYSQMQDLTEEEFKAFQSSKFEFGKIPEKPPTSEMCN